MEAIVNLLLALITRLVDSIFKSHQTVLSQASAHWHSQLKHLKLWVSGCTEEVLKWFNYPPARSHPRCEVSCQGVPNRLALSLCPCFIGASLTVEKVVTCYKANQLVAFLPISTAFSLRLHRYGHLPRTIQYISLISTVLR